MVDFLMNLMIINVDKPMCEVNDDMWVDVVGENSGSWVIG